MVVSPFDIERHLLRQAQRSCRYKAGYVPVTVLLLDREQAVAVIAEDLDLNEATVYRYAQLYREKGSAGYVLAEQSGYWCLLISAQLAALGQELGQTLYTDCRVSANWLATTYGIHHSVSGLTDLLHRMGFSFKLTTAVPCQEDPGQQTAFLTDTLAPLLAQAKAGEAVVYFIDAAHLTHGTRATHVWTEMGKELLLPTLRGRERVTLNTVLNPQCPNPIHLDETDCVNVLNAQQLYKKLLAAHYEGSMYVVCNNARYYKNNTLIAWLAGQRLVQIFLPLYSPNLNLIKRLRKFLRQKIINIAFYCTKGQFKTAVFDFFDRLPEFGREPASRLNLKFYIFDSHSTSWLV